MKVAVYSAQKYEIQYLENINKNKHQLKFIESSLNINTVNLAKGYDAISIFANDDASTEVLNELDKINVRRIAVRAAGFDNVNLKKSSDLSFQVANVPEYSPYAIAEHAVNLILSLNRKTLLANNNVKNYNFSLDDLIGFNLHGKTAGIIGLGKIGGTVAKILHGFGCKIIGFDIKENKELIEKYSLKYVSLEELFTQSDIITLHTPLNNHTQYLINKDSLNLMKKGIMIINTGRGGLLNTKDVIQSLKSGHIGYLGIDVYENEKGLFFQDHRNDILQDDLLARLMSFKNVLITPHQAFLTENALRNIAITTIYNLDCWEKGEKSSNELF